MTHKFTSGRVLVIEQDPYPENPRTWGNYCTMLFFHRRYNLGDKTDIDPSDFTGWEDMEKHLSREFKYLRPVYMYDHGGVTISLNPFSCRWDSGQIGFIGVRKDKDHKFRAKKTLSIMQSEIATYDQYLTGEVYLFELRDKNGDIVDSCAGFFGDNPLENGMLDHLDLTPDELNELKNIKI